LGLQLVI